MIMVTGASGRFSSAVLAELCARGIPAVGGSRTPSVGQRHVDFSVPDGLDFNGVDTLLLVSAGAQEDDRHIALHRAAVEGAARDGVSHLVYTSLTGAGDHLSMALPHRVTERIIMTSGMTWTILRNGVYSEILGALLSWEEKGTGETLTGPWPRWRGKIWPARPPQSSAIRAGTRGWFTSWWEALRCQLPMSQATWAAR